MILSCVSLVERPKSLYALINWYQQFSLSSLDLLKYDVANIRYSKGTRIFGDKCNRFLKSKDSPDLSPTKISSYLSSIISKFTDQEIKECSKLIKNDKRELRYLIKGHFLTNGIINLIKQVVLEETGIIITISIDSLYSLMVNCINNCDKQCQDLKHLIKDSRKAFNEIKN